MTRLKLLWISGSLLALFLLALGTLVLPPADVAPESLPVRAGSVSLETLAGATTGPQASGFVNLPLSFEANRGQTDSRTAFFARGPGYSVSLSPTGMSLALRSARSGKSALHWDTLKLKLAGSRPARDITGVNELPGKVNYFRGDDPSRWQSGVPTFGGVKVEEIYTGVDVVYYGRQRQLEFDFVVAPGADPRAIQFEFDGADDIAIDGEENLRLDLPGGEVRFERPFAYQTVHGERREVASRYEMLADNRIGFRLGQYDAARELIIDPVLSYSTYFGGAASEVVRGMAVDDAGNIYLTGQTGSADLPVVSPVQGSNNGSWDVFVSKIAADGQSLVYSTYLGGAGFDRANDIAVDAMGSAYVTGVTDSADFPVARHYARSG